MPASELRDPEDRTATGTKVKYLYCPECGEYSGTGGVCRVCDRNAGPVFTPPVPDQLKTAPNGPEAVPLGLPVEPAGAGVRPIDEQTYRNTTISGWTRVKVAALVNIRRVVPKGTTGRIKTKRGGMFTIAFDNGRELVKVSYREVGIVEG